MSPEDSRAPGSNAGSASLLPSIGPMDADWTCGRCGVTASFAAGSEQPSEPPGWAKADGEWRCLGCRRIEVTEAAGPKDAPGASAARRRALTEFELLRDPLAPDRVIARRAKCPTRMVTPVRAELRAEGRLAEGE
jgi:hypothetical protein